VNGGGDKNIKITTFRKLAVLPSSGEWRGDKNIKKLKSQHFGS
jgi:hypothetical protein